MHMKDLPRVLVNSSKAPATPKRASVKGNKKVRRECIDQRECERLTCLSRENVERISDRSMS